MMKRADLTEFEIEETDLRLRIARKSTQPDAPTIVQQGTTPPFPFTAQAPFEPTPPPAAETAKPEPEGALIRSPMVGTFYAAPSPESPPFVSHGSKIGADTVVCIVEAMKVMNEIQAEVSGVVAEVLVQNGDSVEYGQPLFRVTPS